MSTAPENARRSPEGCQSRTRATRAALQTRGARLQSPCRADETRAFATGGRHE